MKDTNIRCSVIGLAAEIRVCKKLCMDTNGRCNYLSIVKKEIRTNFTLLIKAKTSIGQNMYMQMIFLETSLKFILFKYISFKE